MKNGTNKCANNALNNRLYYHLNILFTKYTGNRVTSIELAVFTRHLNWGVQTQTGTADDAWFRGIEGFRLGLFIFRGGRHGRQLSWAQVDHTTKKK